MFMTLTQAAAILNVTEGTVRAYARPRAHMSLSARGTYLPHCVALGFVDGLAIAVI